MLVLRFASIHVTALHIHTMILPSYELQTDTQVKLTGDALSAAGGKTIKVSLSHSDTSVVAFAVAQ